MVHWLGNTNRFLSASIYAKLSLHTNKLRTLRFNLVTVLFSDVALITLSILAAKLAKIVIVAYSESLG